MLPIDLTNRRAFVSGVTSGIGAFWAFLASPMAGFISGTTLLVDGGRSALMQDPG